MSGAKAAGRLPGPMGFTLPQFGIFAQGTLAHHFLEFDRRPGVSATSAAPSFRRLRTPSVSAGGVNLVIAFGAGAWQRSPGDGPDVTRPVRRDRRAGGPSRAGHEHHVWMWISGGTPDVTFDHARAAVAAISDVAVLAAEQPGFTYHEGRDETGFVDGTANPPVRQAADVALVPSGTPGEAGSHVLAMRWFHDLEAFHRLSVQEQEGVIGRTKPVSIELTDAEKPRDAHIARVELGDDQEIFRRSVPYGSVEEHGLYFVAFSADPSRYERMLAGMFGVEGPRTGSPTFRGP